MSKRANKSSASPYRTSQENNEAAEQTRLRAQQALKKRQKKGFDFFNQYGYHIVIGAFVGLIAIALATTFFSGQKKLNQTPVINQDEILAHNSQNLSFQLGENEFFKQWMLSDANMIINNQISHKQSLTRCGSSEDSTIIPDKYNFREAHPECAKPIWNQSNCSSSYSIAAVSTANDRYCLQNPATNKEVVFSPQVVLSCDKNHTANTCLGGYVTKALDHGKRYGYVTTECLQYTPLNLSQVTCDLEQCQRFKVQDYCATKGEEQIKREIFKHGPVISAIPMYIDFFVYKSGIYQVLEGTSKLRNNQAIKIIGWDFDIQTGQKYWIIENSFGTTWGENGLARIAENQNLLFLEEYIIAPSLQEQKQETQSDSNKISQENQDIQQESQDIQQEIQD